MKGRLIHYIATRESTVVGRWAVCRSFAGNLRSHGLLRVIVTRAILVRHLVPLVSEALRLALLRFCGWWHQVVYEPTAFDSARHG